MSDIENAYLDLQPEDESPMDAIMGHSITYRIATNSKHRALVTPAKRGKGSIQKEKHISEENSPAQRRAAMTWGQRLKRVFNIDIETCTECGGQLKVIASIRPHGRGR